MGSSIDDRKKEGDAREGAGRSRGRGWNASAMTQIAFIATLQRKGKQIKPPA